MLEGLAEKNDLLFQARKNQMGRDILASYLS